MQTAKQKRRYVGILALVGVGMFGFGYALVPLYQVFCDAFGINGRFFDIEQGVYVPSEKVQATLAKGIDEKREIKVQFLANENRELAMEFHPMQAQVSVHPGEIREVMYVARNLSDKVMLAQAVPSIAPGQAVKYFTKVECFCFSQQTLQPGEEKKMPLRFVVDRNLPRNITDVTLAYTFYESKPTAAASTQSVDKQKKLEKVN